MSVGEKGQVVIPKPLREEFNIMPLDEVEFDQEGDKIILHKVGVIDPVEAFSKAKALAVRKFTEADFKKLDWRALYDEMMGGRERVRK